MLPVNYVINKFYQHAGYPKFNKVSNTYYAGCPTCREGNSWGKKRRLYYIIDDNYLFCQNCSRGWSPLNWISEVSHESVEDVLKDVENYEPNIREIIEQHEKKVAQKPKVPTLPTDSINLMDARQVDYYSNNKVVQDALDFIKERRLDTAAYRSKSLWVSLKDTSNKNRLTIPFYDLNGQIVFYQTRALYDEDNPPKYKSKLGNDKTLFNIERIDPSHDKIYGLEGPIDSMFVKNAVGMCGLTMTDKQREQLRNYPFHEFVYVLDNQLDNDDVYDQYEKILRRGDKIYIWPREIEEKDINEFCTNKKLDEFPHRVIDENVYQGRAGLLRLAALRM